MSYFNKFKKFQYWIPITILTMVMFSAYVLILCFGLPFTLIFFRIFSNIFSYIFAITECAGSEDKNDITSFNKALKAGFPDLKPLENSRCAPYPPSMNANANFHLNIDLGTVAIVSAGTALTNVVSRQSKPITAGLTLAFGFANHVFHQRNKYLLESHKIDMFYRAQIEMHKISISHKTPLSPPSPPDILPSLLERISLPPISVENMDLHEIIINTIQWLDVFILSSLFFLICFVKQPNNF